MDGLFDVISGLIDLLEYSNNDDKRSRRPKNSTLFKFTLFLFSAITFFGLIGQFNLNPQLLADMGWWCSLAPIGWLFAFLSIRFFYYIDHLVNLSIPLLIYIAILFPLMTLVFVGIWFV